MPKSTDGIAPELIHGIDLEQLAEIERRAREKLSAAGLSADVPLPAGDASSVENKLLWLAVHYAKHVRDHVIGERWSEAGESMTRVRHFMDDATFADMADERQKRSEAQEKVSTARIVRALESEPTQAAAAAKLNIDERTIRERVTLKQRQAIRAKKRRR